LDRPSRDQEHIAALFKQLAFCGIELVTVAEGTIGELHVGFKGTMNALFLKDLAFLKTHRGLRGRVERGRSGGGRCYGYALVPGALDRGGVPERGLRRIDGLIRAIEEGLYEPTMQARMQALERRREALEAELATAAEPEPRLHPGLAEVYRQKVATLQEALAAEDGAETREALRALVEAVVLVPDDGRLAIELRGDLAAILTLGANASTRPGGRVLDDLLVQVKLVAGAGFEPATFRL
jgi:hypothetical protein